MENNLNRENRTEKFFSCIFVVCVSIFHFFINMAWPMCPRTANPPYSMRNTCTEQFKNGPRTNIKKKEYLNEKKTTEQRYTRVTL